MPAYTNTHAQRGREKQRGRGRGKTGTLHGAVRHGISTHWPPFYLLWSSSVLPFYQLGAGGDWEKYVWWVDFRNTLRLRLLFREIQSGTCSFIPAIEKPALATNTRLLCHCSLSPSTTVLFRYSSRCPSDLSCNPTSTQKHKKFLEITVNVFKAEVKRELLCCLFTTIFTD